MTYFINKQVKVKEINQRQIMFVADFLCVNYVFRNADLLSVVLTKDKYLTSRLTFTHFLTLNYEHRQERWS